jgi:hypothetical protein
LIEDKEFVKELEKMGVRTVLCPGGVLISMEDAAKIKASVLMGRIKEVYYYANRCGDCILRDLGLSGYWALLK